jgi:hypothetical protein
MRATVLPDVASYSYAGTGYAKSADRVISLSMVHQVHHSNSMS